MLALTRRTRLRNAAAVALTGAFLISVTACGGSALEPKYVQAANQALYGQNPQSGPAVPGGNTVNDPSTGTGVPNAPTGPGGMASNSVTGDSPTGGSKGGDKPPAVKAGSCTGFKNQTGITNSTVTIGNASDISGPIPGLFTSAQQAVRAYVAYFNATTNLCGRKLELKTYDTKTDSGANLIAYTAMCTATFAAIGSMSAFDSGGSSTAQQCGLPDIRTAATTADRNKCSTCFGTQALAPHEFTRVGKGYVKLFPSAAKKAALLFLNAGAAAENAQTILAVNKRDGMNYLYSSGIGVAEFNYGPYVQQMKSKGVELVQFVGAYQQYVRLAQAIQSADYHPEVFAADPAVYDPGYIKTGGSAVNGTIMYVNFSPFEDPTPEQLLYRKWLNQVAPGAAPSFFGIYAWSAAKLFIEESLALGGTLTRASLVAKTRGVTAWTGGGLHAPMQVGPKHAPSCIRFMKLTNGKWVNYGGSKYVCYGYGKA